MAKTRSKSPVSAGGTESMRRRGMKPVLVYLTEDEHRKIRVLAAEAGKPMSHFLRDEGLAASGK